MPVMGGHVAKPIRANKRLDDTLGFCEKFHILFI